jgi:outer membrane protein
MERLKALMNYPESERLDLLYDSLDLQHDIILDTLRVVDYSNRIEYKLLETQRKLLEANIQYNKWAYLPTVSANGAYNMNYLNNDLGKLYNQHYPNSYAGLTLSFPIFQGLKRKYETRQAEWQLKRTDFDIINLKNTINSEYSEALGGYKAALASFLFLKDNVELAREVYDVIDLQYRSGIKSYLEVITAEADLRTAQINYFNALYLVLSNKIDVQRSLGEINP